MNIKEYNIQFTDNNKQIQFQYLADLDKITSWPINIFIYPYGLIVNKQRVLSFINLIYVNPLYANSGFDPQLGPPFLPVGYQATSHPTQTSDPSSPRLTWTVPPLWTDQPQDNEWTANTDVGIGFNQYKVWASINTSQSSRGIYVFKARTWLDSNPTAISYGVGNAADSPRKVYCEPALAPGTASIQIMWEGSADGQPASHWSNIKSVLIT